jgi:hypothetical protein
MTDRQRNRLRAACRQIGNDLAAIAAHLESIRSQLKATDQAFDPDPTHPEWCPECGHLHNPSGPCP